MKEDKMKKSESILEIVKALAKAQGQFKVAAFDKKNPHFKSSYASLESVHNAIREGLSLNGLAISHLIDDGKMITTLFHESGEWLGCELSLPVGLGPQQLGSAITYFRRYSICCLLAIPSGEDDDGNSAEVPNFIRLSISECAEIEALLGDNIELKQKILIGYNVKSLKDIDAKHYRMIVETIRKRSASVIA